MVDVDGLACCRGERMPVVGQVVLVHVEVLRRHARRRAEAPADRRIEAVAALIDLVAVGDVLVVTNRI
jgi:hypothetical protein